MSHDPSSRAPSLSNHPDEHPQTTTEEPAEEETEVGRSSITSERSRRNQRHVQLHKKRAELLDHLIRSLDAVIFCELAAVYYMDCSFLPFMLRALTQLYFLTPKPVYIPASPRPIPYIGGIFGANILCAILHLFLARPAAGEARRGYLHGGLLMDFVGQEGPSSRLRLVVCDALVLLLQLITLAAHVERRALRTGSSLPLAAAAAGQPGPSPRSPNPSAAAAPQTHDSEERGVRRASLSLLSGRGIELDDLSGTAGARDLEGRAVSPPRSPADQSPLEPRSLSSTENVLDVFSSGDVILSDFHLLDTVRTQWWTYENARSRPV